MVPRKTKSRLMPLWMSSCTSARWGLGWLGDELVDLAGDVALQAADGFPAGLAVGDAPGEVGAGVGIPAQPGEHDGVQGAVGASVTTAVEPATLGLAGGGLDRADAAERGEGCFVVEALGVVAGGDEQRRGGVGADTVAFEQPRGVCAQRVGDLAVQIVDFRGQLEDPAGQQGEGLGGCGGGIECHRGSRRPR